MTTTPQNPAKPPLILRPGLSIKGDDGATFITLPMTVEQGPVVVRGRGARVSISLALARQLVELMERDAGR